MNQETRIQRIQEIVDRNKLNPYSYLEIPWGGQKKLRKFPVYEVPLEYLIFNQHNGRIRMRTMTHESLHHTVQADTPEGKELIKKFLYESSDRNRKTEEDIKAYGQKVPGIITMDGVIIDGNRRAMLLDRLGFTKFKAVVLDCKLEDDPLAIEELETRYQLGEDEKVGYNAIEKYLKVSGLKKEGVSYEKIAEWMNEPVREIRFYDDVMKIMEEYLDYYGFNGLYTQLEKREDPFKSLTRWINNFSDGNNPTGSLKGFTNYTQLDVYDLKSIAFDYIRIQYTGEEKSFRKLAEGNRENHLFGDKQIWESFSEKHFEFIQPIIEAESPIDKTVTDLEAHLRDRDEKFKDKVLEFMADNLSAHETMIGNRKAKDKPGKLISEALDKISAIDPKREFDESALNQLSNIQKSTKALLSRKSPIQLIESIISDLKLLENSSVRKEESELFLEKVKELNHRAYELKKSLGA